MPGIRDIKRRIRSVKNTQQITRAMKMVSAAKLRKSQEALVQYRPFGDAHKHMVGRVIAKAENVNHPLFHERESAPLLVVLMTSDKGLCGSFNQNIVRMVEQKLRSLDKDQVAIYAIGKKGREYFRKRGYNIWKYYPMTIREGAYEVAQGIGAELIDAFKAEEFGRVELAYSAFRSALVQVATVESLIPLSKETVEEDYPREYLFEPSAQQVLDTLVPMSVKLAIFRGILETTTSEHGARMASMDAATKNAVDMIASLTLTYNKARQAAITKELIEVVSGADALK